jgi:hypothetical protein
MMLDAAGLTSWVPKVAASSSPGGRASGASIAGASMVCLEGVSAACMLTLSLQWREEIFTRNKRGAGDVSKIFSSCRIVMSSSTADQPLKDTYDNEIFTCECRHCLTARRNYFRDPEAHKRSGRRYYARKKDSILLAQAYERYQTGGRTQKRTLKRLLEAGFAITTPQTFDKKEGGDNITRFVSDGSIEVT